MHDKKHVVEEIFEENERIVLTCQTTSSIYDSIRKITCEGTSVQKRHYTTIQQSGDKVEYRVTLPKKTRRHLQLFFDVLFQDKLVIFCPFDFEDMMKLRKGPKFIDYEKDLPGPVCYDLTTTVTEVLKCVDNNFQMLPKIHKRRKKFFDHIDRHNCDRIHNDIKALTQNHSSSS